jgi:hypothetical protein
MQGVSEYKKQSPERPLLLRRSQPLARQRYASAMVTVHVDWTWPAVRPTSEGPMYEWGKHDTRATSQDRWNTH